MYVLEECPECPQQSVVVVQTPLAASEASCLGSIVRGPEIAVCGNMQIAGRRED